MGTVPIFEIASLARGELAMTGESKFEKIYILR